MTKMFRDRSNECVLLLIAKQGGGIFDARTAAHRIRIRIKLVEEGSEAIS